MLIAEHRPREFAFLNIRAGIAVAVYHFSEIKRAGIGAVAAAVKLAHYHVKRKVAVNGVAVSVNHRCHIKGRFHAALYFKRSDACFRQLVKKRRGAHIV